MVKKATRFISMAVIMATLAGCGYTTKSMLADSLKTIYIAPVKNTVNLSNEISDKDRFRTYRPGLEIDLTNAIINRFIFDGNLKVVSESKANAVVEAKLIDYRRDALRYTEGDDVQEYRLSVVLDVVVYQSGAKRKVLWHETALTGDTSYFLSGARALTEDEAAHKAVEDAARRVVEHTLEIW